MSAPAQRGAERRWMLALNPMLILVEDRVPLLLGPQRWRAGGQYNGGGCHSIQGPGSSCRLQLQSSWGWEPGEGGGRAP